MKKASNHVGTVIHFYEPEYSRKIANYERFITEIRPLIEAYNKWGLTHLTIEKLRAIEHGGATSLLSELTSKLDEATRDFSPVVAQTIAAGQEQQIHNFRVLIGQLRKVLYNNQEVLGDIPVIDGFPALTEEFRENLKDYYSIKVRTAEGSEYYDKFLKAQEAIKDLMETGARIGQHFHLHSDGLVCLSIYE